MELLTTICYGIFGILFFLWSYNKLSRPRNAPPGPFVFPLLGVLPYFRKSTLLVKLEEWKKRYGNIISLQVATTRVIVLHDYNLIKEAYNKDELSGRPSIAPLLLIAGQEKRGLFVSEGPQWEAQRRFALRHLRDFGFGKKSMEGMAYEDINDLIAKFRKGVGQPITVANHFNMSIVNSLWNITAGRRYELDDPEFQDVLVKLKAGQTTAGANAAVFAMDWLTKLAPDLTGWTTFKKSVRVAQKFIKDTMQSHKDTFDANYFRDYMDVYINEIHKTTDPNSSFYKTIGEENLLAGSFNLLAAGAETTSSTLTWAIFYLSRNPSIQQKLHDEIDLEIGRSRLPSLSDKDAMPYASAIMLEVFRKSSLLPWSIPHRAMSDVDFHGYTIAKDSIIIANMYDVHHDKKTWGDAEVFRPERFLTSDRKAVVTNHPPVAPFSVGKRICPGETLARNNFFLFLVSIFQAFEIRQPEGAAEELKPTTVFFRFPGQCEVVFEDRQALK